MWILTSSSGLFFLFVRSFLMFSRAFSTFRTGSRTRQTEVSYSRMIWSNKCVWRANGSQKLSSVDRFRRAFWSSSRSLIGVSMHMTLQWPLLSHWVKKPISYHLNPLPSSLSGRWASSGSTWLLFEYGLTLGNILTKQRNQVPRARLYKQEIKNRGLSKIAYCGFQPCPRQCSDFYCQSSHSEWCKFWW